VVIAELDGEAVADLLRRVGRLPRHVPSLHEGMKLVGEVVKRRRTRRTSPWCQTVCADGEMILGDHTLRFAGRAATRSEEKNTRVVIDARVEVNRMVVACAE
jgi:hypothetical protein